MNLIHLNPVLAQSSQQTSRVLLMIGLVIVLVVVGGAIVMMVRRKLLDPEDTSESTAGIMESLRVMRDRGDLTQAEFEAARRSMIDKAMSRKPVAEPGKKVPGTRPGKPGLSE